MVTITYGPIVVHDRSQLHHTTLSFAARDNYMLGQLPQMLLTVSLV
jgi:hypothetical protein